MRRRAIRAILALALTLPGAAACVDLFHGTAFETFCTKNPTDPSCGGGGDGGVESAADAAGPVPHPDFCAWSAAEAQQHAELACALLGACEGPIDSTRFGPCVAAARLIYDCNATKGRRPRGAVDTLWGCLSQAKTCAEVDTCIFPAGLPAPCPPVTSGTFTTCPTTTPTVRVQCADPLGGRPTAVEPCLLGSRVCTKVNDSFAQCTGAIGKSCSGSPTCSGTSAVICGSGAQSSFDLGLDCAGIGGGACKMVGPDPACTPSDDAVVCSLDASTNPRCDERSGFPVVSSACVTSHDISIDCSAVGARCAVEAGTLALPERACASTSGTSCTGDDQCIGGKLVSCAGDVRHDVDCASLGLGPCVVRDGYAACTKP